MLSDEEKKAIEKLELMEYKYTLTNNDDKAIGIVLNLIEKQSKEIEELKKYEKYYEEMEEVNKKFIAVDKIKAKIEEYEKLSNNITMQPQIYPYIIEVLQSLLEKE